jgi:signal transduction histidine kinase
VRISVAIDENQVAVLLRGFARSLALSLALVAAGLMAAVVAQVTYGLRPLTRIRAGLAAIRRGEQDRLPDDLPLEVQPLATSLNEMIRANDEVVQRARTQAGNLAHALKTPLAILIDEAHRLQAAGQDGSVVLREAERMRRQIDYQLAQARAAASRGRPHAATPVVPAVREIVAAVSRMHRERYLDFALEAAGEDAVAAVEAEDLDELLGNLIENAAKFARSRVAVSVASHGGRVLVHVDDDGPGLPEAAREAVFQVGQRLDEGVPGHGLGLAIVRDIAAQYGGRVAIGTSPLGGARLILELPQAG